MQVKNELQPGLRQKAKLMEHGPDGPIIMVNLLKFRKHAEYKDSSDGQPSGQEAYQRFYDPAVRIIREMGGRVLFAGETTYLMIGHVDELWDWVAVVEYPSRREFLSMLRSKEFEALAHHREAGLAGQLNIESTWIPVPGDD